MLYLLICTLLYVIDLVTGLTTEMPLKPCRKEADVVFVVDSSSNLLYNAFQMYILGTIAEIIQHLDVDSGRTRVAAVQFVDTAKVQSPFNIEIVKARSLKGKKLCIYIAPLL